jgi:hypothetical protein
MDKPYPSDHALKAIKNWDFQDIGALMEFIREHWAFADVSWKQKGKKFSISTVGWSGNESLIGAMHANVMFWSLCWLESKRGGHYKFEVPSMNWRKK